MPQFDIVIVNWNAGDLLRDCISSLGHVVSSGAIGKVVIVDNGSTDDSLEQVEKLDTPVEIHRLPSNRGFGAACNIGAARCESEWIVFLNPDTRIEDSPFERIAQVGQQSDIGVIGIKLVNEQRVVQRHTEVPPNLPGLILRGLGILKHTPAWIRTGRRLNWDHQTSADVGHVIGAFYCIRRSLFERIGGFDRRYFVYFEDMDLSKQVLDEGFRIHYLADVSALHVGGGVTSKVKAKRLFLVQNGRAHYARKHMGVVAAVIVLLSIFSVELVLRAGRGVLQGEFFEVLKAAGMLLRSIPGVFSGTPAN